MNFIQTSIFSLLFVSTLTYAQQIPVKSGEYSAYLKLNQTTQLPVHLTLEKKDKKSVLVIHNATEQIELQVKSKNGDTLILPFPNFDSELRVVARKKTELTGYWINFNKAGNNKIPFYAKFNLKLPEKTNASVQIAGRWETYFSPKSADQEAAVGIFEQTNNKLTGTVLTETGDYRFLEGTIEGNTFYLSAFDGTHAFLLQGKVYEGQLLGTFFSGKSYQTPFIAKRNDTFELRDADSLTVLKTNQSAVTFQLPTIDGTTYVFPNDQTQNKVVIIQIMGTWCPNCMDETKYYKELYTNYHNRGLEIISIGYEAAETFAEQAAKIKRLKERQNLDFTFLVGGSANKSLASSQFNMLNEVISFPTTIFIGKDGTVQRIHTGFNGPGTGSYYTEYVQKTNALIEMLLAE